MGTPVGKLIGLGSPCALPVSHTSRLKIVLDVAQGKMTSCTIRIREFYHDGLCEGGYSADDDDVHAERQIKKK